MMNHWAHPHYRCPITSEPLLLTPYEEETVHFDDQHLETIERLGLPLEKLQQRVKTGILTAEESGFYYPIVNHIPVLLDFNNPVYDHFEKQQAQHRSDWSQYQRPNRKPRPGEVITQKSFTTEWNTVQNDELTFTYNHAERERFISMELDWPPPQEVSSDLKVLNVGCGFGMEAFFLANVVNRPVFGMDANLSLLHVAEHVNLHPLVNVAIASAFAPPYAHESFDLVYSHGVLHHTYHTKRALDSVLRFRKKEGEIYIWVYAHEDAQIGTFGRKLTYLMELMFRPLIARLPGFLQKPIVNLLAWKHYRRYRKKGLKRDSWKFSNSVHSIRDRWTPLFAHRHSFHEVITWFLDNDLDYQLLNPALYKSELKRKLIGISIRGEPRSENPSIVRSATPAQTKRAA